MTAELSQEEIVTKLLSSNEVIINKKEGVCITSHSNLGEYLKTLPIKNEKEQSSSRYTFIKEGGWKI